MILGSTDAHVVMHMFIFIEAMSYIMKLGKAIMQTTKKAGAMPFKLHPPQNLESQGIITERNHIIVRENLNDSQKYLNFSHAVN